MLCYERKVFDLAAWIAANPQALEAIKHKLKRPRGPALTAPILTTRDAGRAERRAAAWLRKVPVAIEGRGGSNATFRVAVVLTRGFLLDAVVALRLMKEWNQACQPPWSDRELEHKVEQSLSPKVACDDGWMLRERQTRPLTGKGYEM
jgi:putative DNA primase/helicase